MEMLVGMSGETTGVELGLLSAGEERDGLSFVGETWKRPTVTTGFESKGECKGIGLRIVRKSKALKTDT